MRPRSPKHHVMALLFVWGGIVLAQALAGVWLPDSWRCFRAWECALDESAGAPFKPHFQWEGSEYGDLANMVGAPQLRASRQTRFTTDAYGFRNASPSQDGPPEIVTLGDSFAIGPGVSDEETLAGVLSQRHGQRVYNYGGGTLAVYLRDARFKQQPPKMLMLVIAERNMYPGWFRRGARRKTHLPRWDSLEAWEAAHAPASIKGWMAGVLNRSEKALQRPSEAAYKGILWSFGWLTLPDTVPYVDPNDHMLFYYEGIENHAPAGVKKMERHAKQVAQRLLKHKQVLASRGTRLVVVVVPDKETIYADKVPALREVNPEATLAFAMKQLSHAGIEHVSLHAELASYRALHPEDLLYLLDDTHPTPRGFEIIGDVIARDILAPPSEP